ncbi:MAG: alkaline phosphatase family protein [Alphaproteobacteria bacterium]
MRTIIPTAAGRLARPLSRREFLAGLAAGAGAAALGGCGDTGSGAFVDPESLPLPAPGASGIDHVVVVMMENRSFDHMLGWTPGADGEQAGLAYPDKQGVARPTWALAPDFQGCSYRDPDHSYAGGRVQFADGANDGWLVGRSDDLFPIGYYRQEDLAFYGGAVPAWTTLDRYFCAMLGPTFPNRIYMHAAQTDRKRNTYDISTLPTIWDRLAGAGLSGRYYYTDLPVTALWGDHLTSISHPIDEFYADAAAGRLPHVAYVDPSFVGEGAGISNDDHPLADVRKGQHFLDRVYRAVASSPNWSRTVLVVNYDEWGGFYDHVPPPLAPRTEWDDVIDNDGRLGFRVPTLIASPFARRGFVGHLQYDHTSVLAMIEWRFGLDPLTVRDATANNLARVLDFSRPRTDAPTFDVPDGPFGGECTGGGESVAAAAGDAERPWRAGLANLAARNGFALPRAGGFGRG